MLNKVNSGKANMKKGRKYVYVFVFGWIIKLSKQDINVSIIFLYFK